MLQSFNVDKNLFIFTLLCMINSLSGMEQHTNNPRHEIESLQRYNPNSTYRKNTRTAILYLLFLSKADDITNKNWLPDKIVFHIASFLKLPKKEPGAALEEWIWRNHQEELSMLEEVFKNKIVKHISPYFSHLDDLVPYGLVVPHSLSVAKPHFPILSKMGIGWGFLQPDLSLEQSNKLDEVYRRVKNKPFGFGEELRYILTTQTPGCLVRKPLTWESIEEAIEQDLKET